MRDGSAQIDDETLAAAYQRGDVEAFRHLLARYERPIYVFCLRMLADPSSAEDACQDVFIKAVRGLRQWSRQARFKTWLYTIARNHCVDTLRKAKHRKTESLDRTSDPSGVAPVDRVAGPDAWRPDAHMERTRLGQAIRDGIARLPPEQREVFVLREHSGLPFKEIAEMTGASENTVKSRMRYALEHLRRSLQAKGFGGDGSS